MRTHQERLGPVDHELHRLCLFHLLALLAERDEGALAAAVLAQRVVLRLPSVQLAPAEEAPRQVGLVVRRRQVEARRSHLLGRAVGPLRLGERPVSEGPEGKTVD